MSEFGEKVEAFRRKWGFDPSPAIESAFQGGEFGLEGGTEDERAFIREVLTGADSGADCAYCLGERCPCTCESDCGARPGGLGAAFRNFCPQGDGYLDYLRGTGFYSEDYLAKLAEGGAR